MTHKEIDTVFQIAATLHTHKYFGERKDPKSLEEVMEWTARQLALSVKVYTIPMGSSWGSPISKERYEEYWAKINKERDESEKE